MMSRIVRLSGPAALVISLLALLFAMSGTTLGAKKHSAGAKLVRVGKNGKISQSVIPKVAQAVDADTVGGTKPEDLAGSCAPDQVDFGSWCLQNTVYAPQPDEVGKTSYFWASQKCVDQGGYLPTAAQLVGAANRVKLSSTLDDNQTTALIDVDPTDGSKDLREMSATLVTTAAGSSSAGTQGVTDGATGDPKQGQPNPVPRPANPSPDTLQYVTVYDNHENGGFAGSEPVSQPERFRCAFNKTPGAAGQDAGGGGGNAGSGTSGSGTTGSGTSGSGSSGSGSTEPKGGGGTTVK